MLEFPPLEVTGFSDFLERSHGSPDWHPWLHVLSRGPQILGQVNRFLPLVLARTGNPVSANTRYNLRRCQTVTISGEPDIESPQSRLKSSIDHGVLESQTRLGRRLRR